jgi:hypothetical protein
LESGLHKGRTIAVTQVKRHLIEKLRNNNNNNNPKKFLCLTCTVAH